MQCPGEHSACRALLRQETPMFDMPECREADFMTRVMARCTPIELIIGLCAAVFAIVAGAAAAPL